MDKNTRHGFEDYAVAKSVVDKASETLARLKTVGDDPAPAIGCPTSTDLEPGLCPRSSSVSSSSQESGSEGEYHVYEVANEKKTVFWLGLVRRRRRAMRRRR